MNQEQKRYWEDYYWENCDLRENSDGSWEKNFSEEKFIEAISLALKMGAAQERTVRTEVVKDFSDGVKTEVRPIEGLTYFKAS